MPLNQGSLTSTKTPTEEIVVLLRSHLADLQARNSRFSLRAFAKRLSLQPSTLSELLNGRREITRNLAMRILTHLAIPPSECGSLLSRLPKGNIKRRRSTLSLNPALLNYLELTNDQFDLIGDWYYLAILSLAETRGFRAHPAYISKRLDIPVAQATRALNALRRLGLMEEKDGIIQASGKRIITTQDVPSSMIRKNHAQALELAQSALLLPVEVREFGAAVLACDPQMLPLAKEKIRVFLKEFSALMEPGAKTQVYRLGVQWFPLTTPN